MLWKHAARRPMKRLKRPSFWWLPKRSESLRCTNMSVTIQNGWLVRFPREHRETFAVPFIGCKPMSWPSVWVRNRLPSRYSNGYPCHGNSNRGASRRAGTLPAEARCNRFPVMLARISCFSLRCRGTSRSTQILEPLVQDPLSLAMECEARGWKKIKNE